MALASPLTAPPPALPWYRVLPPFAWFTHPKQPKRLRPAGHSAWVEAMHQPVLFAISLAFTSAGLYTLAKDYVVKAFTAIGAGDYGQIVPVGLALFVIVITGASIEIAFLTAASRLRMHLLRREWGWTAVSGIMLLLTVGVEGLTCSYMFYLIEAPKLSSGFAAFMANVPTLLFFVRAFAGLVCAAYLIIGVLPFVIRPDDVRREMAAEAGAAKVAIIQRLLRIINDLSVWQMLSIYEPVAAIFRDNAGYTSVQGANRLALAAIGDVKHQFVSTGHWKPEYEALLAPVQKAHETNAGLELERYDEQTHAALTRLQERLQTAAETQGQGGNGVPQVQFEKLVVDLAALRDQVTALPAPAPDPPDMEYRLTEWAQRLMQQFTEQLARVQAQITLNQRRPLPDAGSEAYADLVAEAVQAIKARGEASNVAAIIAELDAQGYAHAAETDVARALVTLGNRLTERVSRSNSVAPGGAGAKTPPKPGTKAFTRWVRKEIGAVEAQGIVPTVAMIAERLNESEATIAPVFEEFLADRAEG